MKNYILFAAFCFLAGTPPYPVPISLIDSNTTLIKKDTIDTLCVCEKNIELDSELIKLKNKVYMNNVKIQCGIDSISIALFYYKIRQYKHSINSF